MTTDLSFLGPGSQPSEEDGELSYMEMPKGMTTFRAPPLPEPEQVAGLGAAKAALGRVLAALDAWTPGGCGRVTLVGLDRANLAFVDQALGEGEVSVICGAELQAQESVLAGVWRVRRTDETGMIVDDFVEIGAFPQSALDLARAGARSFREPPRDFPPGVFNAPALLSEIADKASPAALDGGAHAINLSLLPHTEEDLIFLDKTLGSGALTALSRGYGNCRVMSTGAARVWWVRFYNSQDALILNSIEIADAPEVITAAPEDLADSRQRLEEILGVYS